MKRIATTLLLAICLAGIAQAAFSGNRESKVFHRESCRWFTCKNCTATFQTYEQAIQAGYRPCKVCKPRPSR